MKFGKYILNGITTPAIAGMLLVSSTGFAASTNGAVLRPSVLVPQAGSVERDLQMVQSSDATFRVNQLEEQLRRLNGQLEELNFQLLQMQEQMRRMQEDYEFRFQELEDKKQGSLDSPDTNVAQDNTQGRVKEEFSLEKREPSELSAQSSILDGEIVTVTTTKKPRMIDGVEIFDGDADEAANEGLEMPLGTITFDSLGNVVDTALGKPIDLTASLSGALAQDTQSEGSQNQLDLSSINSSRELFELGYDFIQSGDYHNSQLVFTEFSKRYPDDKKIANAQFWLGESMFSQADFNGAAKIFLDTHTNWPDARIAPQALLKLGISLAGMKQRELACATYVKVYKKYPDLSAAMRNRIKSEQKSAHCLNG